MLRKSRSKASVSETYTAPDPSNFHVRVSLNTDSESMNKVRTLSRSFTFFGRTLARPTMELFFIDQWPSQEEMRWLERSEPKEYIFTGLSAGAGQDFSTLAHLLQPVETEYLVIMGHDTMVATDLMPYLHGSAVAGVPVYENILTQEDWDLVHSYQTTTHKFSGLDPKHFHVKPTDVRFKTTSSQEEIYPLFDLGLIVVPKDKIASLQRATRRHFRTVKEAADSANWLTEKRALMDQIAFTLALVDENIVFEALPFQYNWRESYNLPTGKTEPIVIQLTQAEGDDFWGRIPKTSYKPFAWIVDKHNQYMEPVYE